MARKYTHQVETGLNNHAHKFESADAAIEFANTYHRKHGVFLGVTAIAPKLTLKTAREEAIAVGAVIRPKYSEYQARLNEWEWSHPAVYFTSDLQDALDTAKAMRAHVNTASAIAASVRESAAPKESQWARNKRLVSEAIAAFPETFTLRPAHEKHGEKFRICPHASYVNDSGDVQLVIEIGQFSDAREYVWLQYAKVSIAELSDFAQPLAPLAGVVSAGIAATGWTAPDTYTIEAMGPRGYHAWKMGQALDQHRPLSVGVNGDARYTFNASKVPDTAYSRSCPSFRNSDAHAVAVTEATRIERPLSYIGEDPDSHRTYTMHGNRGAFPITWLRESGLVNADGVCVGADESYIALLARDAAIVACYDEACAMDQQRAEDQHFERMCAQPCTTLDHAMACVESEAARRIIDAAVADVVGECAHWVPRVLARMGYAHKLDTARELAAFGVPAEYPAHPFTGEDENEDYCEVCGMMAGASLANHVEIVAEQPAPTPDPLYTHLQAVALAASSGIAYSSMNDCKVHASAWSAARADYDATRGAGAFDALSSIDFGAAKPSRNQAVREYIASL